MKSIFGPLLLYLQIGSVIFFQNVYTTCADTRQNYQSQERRLVLHDDENMAAYIMNLSATVRNMESFLLDATTNIHRLENTLQESSTKIKSLESSLQTSNAKIQGLQNTVASLQVSGSTYVRWGRKTCPGNGTYLVYSGFAGGSEHSETGGGTNYICLSPDPIWDHYQDEVQHGGKVYGAEYQFGELGRSDFFSQSVYDEDVPCAVCRSSRPTAIMIPGRNACYEGWTLEYAGYLTTGASVHTAASEFVCVDAKPEVIIGGHTSNDGKLFYFTEGICGSLKCPPYVNGRELTCAVCTK